MPRPITLSAQHLEVCDNTLRAKGLIAPNRAILAAIILKSSRLTRLVKTGYSGELIRKWRAPQLDTYESDYLFDAVAQEYTGRHWPCFGDTEEVTVSFKDTLIERASQAGWVFDFA